MLQDLILKLTPDQRKQLQGLGVSRQRLHEWKHGMGNPTEVQVAMLAAVTGTEYGQLQREVTWTRATPAERGKLARALGKTLAGVAAMLGIFGANDSARAAAHATKPACDNV